MFFILPLLFLFPTLVEAKPLESLFLVLFELFVTLEFSLGPLTNYSKWHIKTITNMLYITWINEGIIYEHDKNRLSEIYEKLDSYLICISFSLSCNRFSHWATPNVVVRCIAKGATDKKSPTCFQRFISCSLSCLFWPSNFLSYLWRINVRLIAGIPWNLIRYWLEHYGICILVSLFS